MTNRELPPASIQDLLPAGRRVVQVLSRKELAEALGEPEEEPIIPPRPDSSRDLFHGIDEGEAKRLGLERLEIEGNIEAQKMMERIFDQSRPDRFDVASSNDKKAEQERARFKAEWDRLVGNRVPIPMTASWHAYIRRLAEGNIISNLDIGNKKKALPSFDKKETLWAMDFGEQNGGRGSALVTHVSLLLKELGIANAGVVNISRRKVDEALWAGDPSDRIKTPKHIEVIRKLGLNPDDYNFRCIKQDEYARAAGAGHNFGNSNLWTWFHDYWVEGADVHGLSGGIRDRGGASYVAYDSRGAADPLLAVRLVLERI